MLICCIRGFAGATGFRTARLVWLCLAAVLLAGCTTLEKANSLAGGNSEVEAKKEAEWAYRERGVVLNVIADPGLNEYGGMSHAVALVVAQTADPAAFNTFVKTTQTVGRALQAGEAPGVLSLERIFVEPGTTQRIVLDRVDKARYVGVAAAYFEGDPMRNARIFAVGVDIRTTGIVVKNSVATPLPLGLNVRLGDKALLYARPVDVAEALPGAGGESPEAAPLPSAEPAVRVQNRTGPETRLGGGERTAADRAAAAEGAAEDAAKEAASRQAAERAARMRR
jgi:type VI secretion system VasD/TssJ family lipoprotein